MGDVIALMALMNLVVHHRHLQHHLPAHLINLDVATGLVYLCIFAAMPLTIVMIVQMNMIAVITKKNNPSQ